MKRRILTPALVLALSVGVLSPVAAYADPTPTTSSPTAPLVMDPTKEILDARARLASLQHDTEVAAEAYNAAKVDLDVARSKEVEAKAAADTARTAYLDAQLKVAVAKKKVEVAQDRLGRFAAASYRMGSSSKGISAFNTILDSESLTDGAHQAGLLEHAGDVQVDALKDVQAAKAAADAAQAVADDAKAVAENAESTAVSASQTATQRSIEAQTHADTALKASDAAAALLLQLETDQARKEREERDAAAAQEAAAAEQALVDAWVASQDDDSTNDSGTGSVLPPVDGPTEQAKGALRYAFAQAGKPYVWGATGPNSFDCSGLTSSAWAAAGVKIPRTSRAQYAGLPHVARADLQPGDLVFYGSSAATIHHVGMYIGNGMMIHAPHTGTVVKVAPLMKQYVGAARPFGAVAPTDLAGVPGQ